MEPYDFDKLLKEKLENDNDLHSYEIESAKPFIWSAIQNNVGGDKTIKWYHLAAALILLILSFAFILINVQKSYKSEIQILSQRIDEIQDNYKVQGVNLDSKVTEIEKLNAELDFVESQLITLQSSANSTPKPRLETITVFQRDTVFVKEVEYITLSQKDTLPLNESSQQVTEVEIADIKSEVPLTDIDIYPSYSQNGKKRRSESIKLKFGSVLAQKN